MATKTPSLSADERAAIKARAKELKSEKTQADQLKLFQGALDDMPAAERAIADKLHAMVQKAAPSLHPKTFYGMPAWANADDKIVCFFQSMTKFKARYNTFGFEAAAKIDDGTMWGTGFALTDLSASDEKKLAGLVKKAAG